MASVLSLDQILSSAFHFTIKWSPELDRTKARDLLRFLIIRLYDQGRGNLHTASFTHAQTTLARKFGLSRQWVGILLQRLQAAGWIEFSSPRLSTGINGSTVFRIGRMLKRLLAMLSKSRPKKREKPADKSTWHFSPTNVEKRTLLIHEKENRPLPERILTKIPLLSKWMERGILTGDSSSGSFP